MGEGIAEGCWDETLRHREPQARSVEKAYTMRKLGPKRMIVKLYLALGT